MRYDDEPTRVEWKAMCMDSEERLRLAIVERDEARDRNVKLEQQMREAQMFLRLAEPELRTRHEKESMMLADQIVAWQRGIWHTPPAVDGAQQSNEGNIQ